MPVAESMPNGQYQKLEMVSMITVLGMVPVWYTSELFLLGASLLMQDCQNGQEGCLLKRRDLTDLTVRFSYFTGFDKLQVTIT